MTKNMDVAKAYLDTSAVIALSPKLVKIAPVCYTSALAIFEIISSINEKKFLRRRGVINSIFSSKIQIDWRMPNEIICSAFPNVERRVESEGEIVKEIGSKICQASSYEEMHSIFEGARFTQTSIKKIDDRLGSESVSNAEDWLKKHTPHQGGLYVVTFDKAIDSILNYYCASFTEDQKVVVKRNYNGSIDEFITILCLYQSFRMNARQRPADNDWIDLHHMLYLQKGCRFVTDDKIQFNVVNAVLEGIPITVTDFNRVIASESPS